MLKQKNIIDGKILEFSVVWGYCMAGGKSDVKAFKMKEKILNFHTEMTNLEILVPRG